MKTALFSFGKDKLPANSNLSGSYELFAKLRDRDIDPVVSLQAEEPFYETGVMGHELLTETTARPLGHVSLREVGVIVNRLNRSFKRERMPDEWNGSAIPTINENEMRSLAFRKHRTHEEVFEPLGLGIPTALIETAADAACFVEEHPSEQYILKPDSGYNSLGIRTLTGTEAVSLFAVNPPEEKLVMQPKYDFSGAFDAALKPFDAMSNEAFEGWSQSGEVKELRMYGFMSPEGIGMFPAGRAIKGGEDNWFFVDPESVPDRLYENTRSVVSRAAAITGSRAVYAALDFGYGTKTTADTPDYHILELNARMPYLIGYDKHPLVADTLRDIYADQIQHTATHTQ